MTLNQFFSPSERDLAAGISRGLESGDETFVVKAGPGIDFAKLKWNLLANAAAKHVGGLLDVRITDIMSKAWEKSQKLKEHLDKSAASPGESMLLPLATHTITSEHRPFIEVLRGGKQIARLEFAVSVALVVEGAVLRIANGAIQEVQTGEVRCKGALSCGPKVLIEKKLQPLSLPGSIVLGGQQQSSATAD